MQGIGGALADARDSERLGSIAAGSDGHNVSVSNGKHVVVSLVGVPNPVRLYAGDTNRHHDLVTVGDELLELRAQTPPELPLQGTFQLASTVADLRFGFASLGSR
jgi:hypothetical protein